ncbi:MAG TPA: thioredoxin domain-containing protein [Allosphingosinicella sp.]|jgi:protein-disulfide isomerase
MIRASLAFALAAALPLGAAADAAPARRAAPAARDWSRAVVATPEGGFRMGNPAAPVKLVEYGSLTCPHCAAFAREGAPPLVARYVRTGKVSYEFRNYILNGVDVTATLLARCAGSNFFRMADRLYATQPEWMDRIAGLSNAEKDQLKALPEGQRLLRLAEIGGLTQLAGRYGVAPARARRCLADPAGMARLGKIYEAANAAGVQGTPTFFVNGTLLEGNTWAAVEPALRRAGG